MKTRQERGIRTCNQEWSEKGKSASESGKQEGGTHKQDVDTEVCTTSLLEKHTKRRENDGEACKKKVRYATVLLEMGHT